MKKALSIMLAVLLMMSLFSLTSASAEVQNLLPITEENFVNKGYGVYIPHYVENGLLGKEAGIWRSSDDNEGVTFDTETVKFGKQSIKVVRGESENSCVSFPVAIGHLEIGKTYTFQAYVKTSKVISASSGAFLSVEAKAVVPEYRWVAGFEGGVSSVPLTGTKDWQLLFSTFTVPDDPDAIFIFNLGMFGTFNGTAWFDGLALVEGDTPIEDYESIVPYADDNTDTPATPAPVAPTLNGEPSAWAKEEILKALEADLVPEHVNSNYTTDITRSDFCDLIIKMIEKKSGKAIADVIAGYADAKADVSFPDTDSANVIAAAKLGIVNGRSSGAFDPTANITRQEAAKMLALAAKVLGADITASEVAFADADDIYAWAKEFIYYVNTIGVMNGTSTTTPPNFSPLRTYTREQSILTVYRLFNAI
ncbi:MAG: hypothetical protein E7491_04595 [Ruminococcaceae bacterium]|nr:hypothetical protein [Oscillospiraceae bacterium]